LIDFCNLADILAVHSILFSEFWEIPMPTAEVGATRLHYEVSGPTTGPVIVLVNSLGADLHMWDMVLPYLEKDFQVLRYDARGHGLSTAPPIPYSIEQLSTDLLKLLETISVDTFCLCGLSLGGMVGMWLGVHAPRKVAKLVLANTAARIGTREGWDARIVAVQSLGITPLAETTLGRWFTPKYRQEHPEEMNEIREMIERTSPEGYIGCCGVLRDTDLRTEIDAIETPCLVITGCEDPATPPQDGRALHTGLRNSEYLELNASHLSAWERSAEFADAILHFFRGEERANG
jgi:3-oxoadipate enol-lactonase